MRNLGGLLREIKKRKPWQIPELLVRQKLNSGYCPICESKSIFAIYQDWLRDHYRCLRCWSIPRERALVKTLQDHFPTLSTSRVYESSPGTISSRWISSKVREYVASHFYEGEELGKIKGIFRCENLENLTFSDRQFDLVITQDVMEHVMDPARAFKEIERILRPGGAHVFTVPIYSGRKTRVRANYGESGFIEYLMAAEFHGNPIDKNGSLVVTEWGDDLPEFIEQTSGLRTRRFKYSDVRLGLDGEFLEVLISSKSNSDS